MKIIIFNLFIVLTISVEVFAVELDKLPTKEKTTNKTESHISDKPPPEIDFEFKTSSVKLTEEIANFSINPRITVGEIFQTYTEIYDKAEDIRWQGNMPIIETGITFSYSSFSFDIYAQKSQSAKDSFFGETNIQNTIITDDDNAQMNREDYAINFGYTRNLFFDNDHIAFSIGYKIGKTNIDITNRTVTFLNNEQNLFNSHDYTKFKTKGSTVGVFYGFPIYKKSILGLNLGYAWLKTEHSSSKMIVHPDSTSGITIGLRWYGLINNNITYSFSVDSYKYTMDAASAETSFVSSDGVKRTTNISLSSIEESVVSFKASLSYIFDW